MGSFRSATKVQIFETRTDQIRISPGVRQWSVMLCRPPKLGGTLELVHASDGTNESCHDSFGRQRRFSTNMVTVESEEVLRRL